MRTIPARTAACEGSNFIANVSCCTVPSRACGWRSTFASATFSASRCAVYDDAQMLVLVHRDPALNIPLCVSSDREEIVSAWQKWSDIFALPQLMEDDRCEPAARRRRHNAIRARRPKFLVRRRAGNLLNTDEHSSGRTRDHRAGLRFVRHCERSEAIHTRRQAAERWNCFACARNDVDTASRSRGLIRPRFAGNFPPSESEGAGKTGCLLHPRSRVRFAHKQKVHTSIQGSGSIPAFPAQWLYGLLRALPGERLFCHRRPREALPLADLTPAPRRQDHTTSPYAQATLVSRGSRVHRISPHVRDDGQRPSSAVRQAELCD